MNQAPIAAEIGFNFYNELQDVIQKDLNLT